jgi:hypothetical protein
LQALPEPTVTSRVSLKIVVSPVRFRPSPFCEVPACGVLSGLTRELLTSDRRDAPPASCRSTAVRGGACQQGMPRRNRSWPPTTARRNVARGPEESRPQDSSASRGRQGHSPPFHPTCRAGLSSAGDGKVERERIRCGKPGERHAALTTEL